ADLAEPAHAGQTRAARLTVLVALIALLAAVRDAVAAHLGMAVRGAAVAGGRIAVVTFLVALRDVVAARLLLADVVAAVAVDVVAVVALLAQLRLERAVAAVGRREAGAGGAAERARLAVLGAEVALFVALLHAVAAGLDGALRGAGVAGIAGHRRA